MNSIKEFLNQLDKSRRITITTHPNPDADALGSSLGLAHYLNNKGHQTTIITPTDFPDFLEWMPGSENVICFSEETKDLCVDHFLNCEILFCLDFSSLNRLKDLEQPLLDSKATKVLIDHHLDPENFADYALWDTKAAATAELIFDLIEMDNSKEEITPDIANCLYAGIMTDTGSFKHPSTTAKVHRIVAELIDLGADVNYVSKSIYDTNSLNRIRFLGFVLLERLIIHSDLQIAYMVIKADDFKKFNIKNSDTEGLVNYALSIKGIIMATIIIERSDEIKLSFRSVNGYAVNTFANKHFSGGGHQNASGGSSKLNLEETIAKYESLILDFREKYKVA